MIYRMPKTELRLRRYKQSKIAKKIRGRGKVNLDLGFTVHARIWIWARRGTDTEDHRRGAGLAGERGCGRGFGRRRGGGEEAAKAAVVRAARDSTAVLWHVRGLVAR